MSSELRAVCDRGDLHSVIALTEVLPQDPSTKRIIKENCGEAISRRHLQVARYLLDKGASVDDLNLRYYVFSARSIPMFELLLEYGFDFNPVISQQSSMLAACLDDESLVRWLLDHGVDLNRGPFTCSPGSRTTGPNFVFTYLEMAARTSSIAVFDLLLERGARLENSFPLHDAAARPNDRIAMMRHLLELGVDINGSDELRGVYMMRGTPLHYAIESRRAESVRLLLENGANPHLLNSEGHSALDMSQQETCSHAVEVLMQSTSYPA